MNQFNLGNFLNRFINSSLPNSQGRASNASQSSHLGGSPLSDGGLSESSLSKSLLGSKRLNHLASGMLNNLKMNHLVNSQKSLYLKDLMNLPKDMKEILVLLQKNPATNEDATKLLAKNISLASLSEMMQKNGKEAMNKLVVVMANAAKQGVTDTSQIKDAMKLVGASVAVGDSPAQTLKNFMLLYLPWLPLTEGVDFELEIESSDGGGAESEITITILISTINYGNIRVTLFLLAGNSMSIVVNCADNFPEAELLKRIKEENKKHSIQSDVTFEQKEFKQDKDAESSTRQAKISMSNLTEVNPFLLLMANAVIRHTIELDNQFAL